MKKITLILTFLALLCLNVNAREIKGVVSSGCHKLSNVLVTDGVSFAQTDARGRFVLDVADNAKFVSVIAPTGYIADYSSGQPKFYQKITESDYYKFKLKKFECGNKFNIIALADPQTKSEEHFAQLCGEPMKCLISEAKQISREAKTIGITLGDICWDNLPHLARYKAEVKKTGVPFFAVIGNHDYNDQKVGYEAAVDFEEVYGPLDWASYIGDALIIGLNDIQYNTHRGYKVGYSQATLDWVKKLLSFVSEDTQIFICQHSPLDLWYDKKWADRSDDMLSILGKRKVDFITGHRHYHNQLKYSENIKDHNIAALSGTFWESVRCWDGTPMGFEVFNSVDGKLSWYYQPVYYSNDLQVEIAGPGESRYFPKYVVANIWDADENWKIQWYEDGKLMGDMEPCMDTSPEAYKAAMEGFKVDNIKAVPGAYRPVPNKHFFRALPGKNAKIIRVHVENPFGKKWDYDINIK